MDGLGMVQNGGQVFMVGCWGVCGIIVVLLLIVVGIIWLMNSWLFEWFFENICVWIELWLVFYIGNLLLELQCILVVL